MNFALFTNNIIIITLKDSDEYLNQPEMHLYKIFKDLKKIFLSLIFLFAENICEIITNFYMLVDKLDDNGL